MAKLNTTDRRLLAKEILKKISTVNKYNQKETVDKYILDSGQKKKYDSIVKKEKRIEELQREVRESFSELMLPSGSKYESYYYSNNGFRERVFNDLKHKVPSQEGIETMILLSGDTDLNALVKSIVAVYSN
jgi:hypothetical protein